MIILIILLNLILLAYLFIKNDGIRYIFSRKMLKYLIFLGVVAVILFVAYGVENFLNIVVSGMFQGLYKVVNGMVIWNKPIIGLLYNFVVYFLITGVTEELLKTLPVFALNREFFKEHLTTKYDCIIPFLIVGMGFSIVEDILYIYVYYDGATGVDIVRLLTEFSGHTLWALLIGMGYYKYIVKYRAERLAFNLRTRKLNYINTNLGMSSKSIFALSCAIVIYMHGLFDFLLATFPILGLFFIAGSFVYFIVFLILLRNSSLKIDSFKTFMKHQEDIEPEFIKEFIEDKKIRY